MWAEIDQFVQEYHMFDQVSFVVAGLSGGADSVCLARYLIHLQDLGGPRVVAVHVNHMLRGPEADRDEAFVRSFCRTWEIPLDVFARDVRQVSKKDRESLEEAGRKVRYACFHETMDRLRTGGKVCLCLAHHADDLAETMLFRMIRGTGPSGLTGIRPVQGEVLRPFLHIRKEKILHILDKLGQDYVTDTSNGDLSLSRNYIRHRILPEMEELNPRVTGHLISLSGQMADLMDFARDEMDSICAALIREGDHGYEVDAAALSSLPAFASQETARRLLFLASGREKDIGSIHVRQLLRLAGKEDGKRNDFPYGIVAIRRAGKLCLCKASRCREKAAGEKESEKVPGLPIELILPAFEDGKEWTMELPGSARLLMKYETFCGQQIINRDCVKYFDYDTIKNNLYVRTRKEGDFFVFDDQGRHKLLSRYFIDRKIPAGDRDRKLLLCDGSHVLWILGERISRVCKITGATKRMLVVILQYKKE